MRLSIRLLVVLIAAPAALACVCIHGPVKQGFVKANAVFVGRAVDRQSGEEIANKFEVIEQFKGPRSKEIVVMTEHDSSCGRGFEIGETYLVFAQRDASGVLRDSLCTHTDRASNESKLQLVRSRYRWWRTCIGRLTLRR